MPLTKDTLNDKDANCYRNFESDSPYIAVERRNDCRRAGTLFASRTRSKQAASHVAGQLDADQHDAHLAPRASVC